MRRFDQAKAFIKSKIRPEKSIGNYAEDYAEMFLKNNGHKILERNFSTKYGEIDIITQKNEYIVFVEVKFRKNNDFGGGAEAIDFRKQERIKKTSQIYLQKKKISSFVRFDVVLITTDKNRIYKDNVEVIEDAFQ